MLSRKKVNQMEVEYRKFERTVNYLLNESRLALSSTLPLLLRTDPGSKVPLGENDKLSYKVDPLARDDGTESRPDAILETYEDSQLEQLKIVIDAKFYSNEIPVKVIEKTLDDMRLRSTRHGILICSELTGRQEFDSIKQSKIKGLKLIKLQREAGLAEPNGTCRYAAEYMTRDNQQLINKTVLQIIQQFQAEVCQQKKNKLFRIKDDHDKVKIIDKNKFLMDQTQPNSTEASRSSSLQLISRTSDQVQMASFKNETKKTNEQIQKTDFQQEIDDLVLRIQEFGLKSIADTDSRIKLTKAGEINRVNKYGRALYPRIKQLQSFSQFTQQPQNTYSQLEQGKNQQSQPIPTIIPKIQILSEKVQPFIDVNGIKERIKNKNLSEEDLSKIAQKIKEVDIQSVAQMLDLKLVKAGHRLNLNCYPGKLLQDYINQLDLISNLQQPEHTKITTLSYLLGANDESDLCQKMNEQDKNIAQIPTNVPVPDDKSDKENKMLPNSQKYATDSDDDDWESVDSSTDSNKSTSSGKNQQLTKSDDPETQDSYQLVNKESTTCTDHLFDQKNYKEQELLTLKEPIDREQVKYVTKMAEVIDYFKKLNLSDQNLDLHQQPKQCNKQSKYKDEVQKSFLKKESNVIRESTEKSIEQEQKSPIVLTLEKGDEVSPLRGNQIYEKHCQFENVVTRAKMRINNKLNK